MSYKNWTDEQKKAHAEERFRKSGEEFLNALRLAGKKLAIIEKICEILSEKTLTKFRSYDVIGSQLDSLELVGLETELEEEFLIEIPNGTITMADTPSTIADKLL